MSWTVRRNPAETGPGENFYVVRYRNDTPEYLHVDGSVGLSTRSQQTMKFTGFYATSHDAEVAIETYENAGEYQVVVGNIGTVLSTRLRKEAIECFCEYVTQSKSQRGSVGGEPVTLMLNGDPEIEYEGEE